MSSPRPIRGGADGAPHPATMRWSVLCVTTLLLSAGLETTVRSQSGTGRYVLADGAVESREGSTVTVFDLDTNRYVTSLPTGLAGALSGLAVNRAGTRVYVASESRHRLHAIDTAAGAVIGTAPVQAPRSLVLAPDASRLYVASANRVLVLDAATLAPLQTLPLPTAAGRLALSADGSRLYVADGSNTLPLSLVRRLDPLSGQILATSAQQSAVAPFRLAVGPGGTRLYVTDRLGGLVHVLDATTLAEIQTIPISGWPTALAMPSSGNRIYVADDLNRARLHVIDTEAGSVATTLELGGGFTSAGRSVAMLVSPDGQRLVRADADRSGFQVYTLASGASVGQGQWLGGLPSLIAASEAFAGAAVATAPAGCRAPYCLDECVDALGCGSPSYCDEFFFCGALLSTCGYSGRRSANVCRFDIIGRCPECGQ